MASLNDGNQGWEYLATTYNTKLPVYLAKVAPSPLYIPPIPFCFISCIATVVALTDFAGAAPASPGKEKRFSE